MFVGDPLRDPIWQFIGVLLSLILGVTSAVISLAIYFKQRSSLEITYSIIENKPILITENIGEFLEKKLEINYLETSSLLGIPHQQVIKEIHSIELKVFNSGNNSIKKEQYTPLLFEFSPETKVLYIQLIDKQPSDLEVKLDKKSYEKNKVLIEPVLLKRKESFTFKVLIDRFNSNNEIKSRNRFAEVELRRSDEKPNLFTRRLIAAFDFVRNVALVVCIILSFILIYNVNINQSDHIGQYVIVISIILFTYIIIFILSKFINDFLEKQNKGYPKKIKRTAN